jgi:hypothetical protein
MGQKWEARFSCEGCGIRVGVPTSWRSWWWDWYGDEFANPDSEDVAVLCYACSGHREEPADMTVERMPALEEFVRFGYEVYPHER